MECLIRVRRLSTIGDTSSSSTPSDFLFQAVSNPIAYYWVPMLNCYYSLHVPKLLGNGGGDPTIHRSLQKEPISGGLCLWTLNNGEIIYFFINGHRRDWHGCMQSLHDKLTHFELVHTRIHSHFYIKSAIMPFRQEYIQKYFCFCAHGFKYSERGLLQYREHLWGSRHASDTPRGIHACLKLDRI